MGTLAPLARATWLLRLGALGLVAVLDLVRGGGEAAGLAELAVAAVALGVWLWADVRQPPRRERLLLGSLTALAAAGGVAAASPHEASGVSFALVALLAAGTELAALPLLLVGAVGVLAIEVGAVAYDQTSLGVVLGYPAGLGALALAGRYRRTYRHQAEQAQLLLLASARAQEESRRASALDERARIAREIHDVLAHSLGALGVQLQTIEVLLADGRDVDGALRATVGARRLVDEGLTEARRAVSALRADLPPLPEALAALVDGTPDAVAVTGTPFALSPAAGLTLLRIAQEALTNARKHAPERPVSIALAYAADGVDLRVANDLPGGDPRASRAPGGGYGLAGMHERLRLIDGSLTAGPADGRWVVHAQVAR